MLVTFSATQFSNDFISADKAMKKARIGWKRTSVGIGRNTSSIIYLSHLKISRTFPGPSLNFASHNYFSHHTNFVCLAADEAERRLADRIRQRTRPGWATANLLMCSLFRCNVASSFRGCSDSNIPKSCRFDRGWSHPTSFGTSRMARGEVLLHNDSKQPTPQYLIIDGCTVTRCQDRNSWRLILLPLLRLLILSFIYNKWTLRLKVWLDSPHFIFSQ